MNHYTDKILSRKTFDELKREEKIATECRDMWHLNFKTDPNPWPFRLALIRKYIKNYNKVKKLHCHECGALYEKCDLKVDDFGLICRDCEIDKKLDDDDQARWQKVEYYNGLGNLNE